MLAYNDTAAILGITMVATIPLLLLLPGRAGKEPGPTEAA